MIAWRTERRKISDLIPHPENPRKMTEKQVKDLTASLKKFNLAEIPAINTDNTILAGHQRLAIMAQLGRGDEKIDVRVPDRQLSEKEAKEYLVRSNKNTGEWDWDKLANNFDLDDLTEWGFTEYDTKTNFNECENGEIKDEETMAKISVIYVRMADWVLWKNQIINFLNDNKINYNIEE